MELYGVNDNKLELLKKRFPKLKIIARGNTIKVMCDDGQSTQFESIINILINHYNKYGNITEGDIERLLKIDKGVDPHQNGNTDVLEDDIIVFGNGGLVVKARTPNQRLMVESCIKK